MQPLVATTIACVLACAPLAGAQENRNAAEPAPDPSLTAISQPAGPPPTPVHTGVKALIKGIGRDFVQLPSTENLYWSLGGGAAALAAHQADDYVQEHVGGNSTADAFFKPGAIIGNVVPIAGSVSTYVWDGRAISPRSRMSGRT